MRQRRFKVGPETLLWNPHWSSLLCKFVLALEIEDLYSVSFCSPVLAVYVARVQLGAMCLCGNACSCFKVG